MTNGNTPPSTKITAFNSIFEEKLKKIIKNIKKVKKDLKKDPSLKEKLKNMLTEAKALKKQLSGNKSKSPDDVVGEVLIPIAIDPITGELRIDENISATENITISKCTVRGNIVHVRMIFNKED